MNGEKEETKNIENFSLPVLLNWKKIWLESFLFVFIIIFVLRIHTYLNGRRRKKEKKIKVVEK